MGSEMCIRDREGAERLVPQIDLLGRFVCLIGEAADAEQRFRRACVVCEAASAEDRSVGGVCVWDAERLVQQTGLVVSAIV